MAELASLASLLRITVPAIYGLAAACYAAEFARIRDTHFRMTIPALAAGIALHVLLVVALALELHRLPCDTVFHGLLFGALVVSLFYLGMERFLGEIRYGAIIVPANCIVTAIAAAYLEGGVPLPARLHSLYFVIHALLLFLAYACFFLSFGIACLYLVQHRQITRRRLGGLFRRLPALADMDESIMRADALGLGLLLVGIAAGFLWMEVILGEPTRLTLKIALTCITATVYLCEHILRVGKGWNGRRACWISIVGFLFVFITLAAGRHGY